jgi:N-acetylglucosaminyl-diphospho-decaprenol L-rhamnosyltransferase
MSVDAILVHYGDAAPTETTAARLAGVVDRVVVVDNSGNLALPPSMAEVIVPGANIGFGAGANLAARLATAEFLLFHNPDAAISPTGVATLVATARHHRALAVLAPRLAYEDGSSQINGGRFSGWMRETARCTGAGRVLRAARARVRRETLGAKRKRPIERAWVSAAVWLVRREAFAQVGGFDERFFLYYEDEDLCRRLQQVGWRTAVDPSVTATHAVGGSSEVRDPYVSAHFEQSRALYHRLHSGPLLRRLVSWDARRRVAGLRFEVA